MITHDTVFSDEVTIHAPVETVWAVLVDFERYSEWNEFCPSIKTRLEVDAPVDMMVDLGDGLQNQVEYFERIETNSTLVWSVTMGGPGELFARRTQTLTPIDQDSCTYVTDDRFEGTLVSTVLDAFGPAIERGFNTCALGLKRRAESLRALEER